jgi:3-vinyl bacteriochlorophyllide hydratase
MRNTPGGSPTSSEVLAIGSRSPYAPGGVGGPKFGGLGAWIGQIAPCPWFDAAGSISGFEVHAAPTRRRPLYTPEQRRRRDATRWTTVQGVLAPIQFAVFLISLGLVLNYLAFGRGYDVATASIILKTVILYAIMVTGSIWEKEVFGKFLFAPAFFWEDVVSMLVLALHTAYLIELVSGWGSPDELMWLALAAYASYALNATQFLLKLRAARLESPGARVGKFYAGSAQ